MFRTERTNQTNTVTRTRGTDTEHITPAETSGVETLTRGTGPLSPNMADRTRQSEAKKEAKLPMPPGGFDFEAEAAAAAEAQAAKEARLDGQVTTQKGVVDTHRTDPTKTKLEVMTEVFKLEGMALERHPGLRGDLDGMYTHLNSVAGAAISMPHHPNNFNQQALSATQQKTIAQLEGRHPQDAGTIGTLRTALATFNGTDAHDLGAYATAVRDLVTEYQTAINHLEAQSPQNEANIKSLKDTKKFLEENGSTARGPRTADLRDALTATHSSYLKAIAHLEAQTPADADAIRLVKNALTSFKQNVWQQEIAREKNALEAAVDVERMANQIAILPASREQRENATKAAKDALKEIGGDLATFKQASNFILHDEHLEFNLKNSINWEKSDTWGGFGSDLLKNLAVWGRGAGALSIPQGGASGLHWGALRALAGQLAKDYGGIGRHDEAKNALARGGALGVAHDLVSGGLRDGIHGIAEAGGYLRPPEAISPDEHFPRTPPVRVNDNGEVERLTPEQLKNADVGLHTEQLAYLASLFDSEKHGTELRAAADAMGSGDVKAGFDVLHKRLGAMAGNFNFGSLRGDSVGNLWGFPAANMLKDGLIMSGHMAAELGSHVGVNTGVSALGGVLMEEERARGHLNNKYAGLPTHRLAKHQNPRTILERMWNGAQTLDYTQQSNRMRLFGKFTSSSLGMYFGNKVDTAISEPLEHKIAARKAAGESAAWLKVGHVGAEGLKSYLALQSFFGDTAAAGEAGKLKSKSKESLLPTERIELGFQNATQPGRAGATLPHSSTFGQGVDKTHNIMKGTTQIAHQTAAVGIEGVTQLGIAGVKGTFNGIGSVVGGLTSGAAWFARGGRSGARLRDEERGDDDAPPPLVTTTTTPVVSTTGTTTTGITPTPVAHGTDETRNKALPQRRHSTMDVNDLVRQSRADRKPSVQKRPTTSSIPELASLPLKFLDEVEGETGGITSAGTGPSRSLSDADRLRRGHSKRVSDFRQSFGIKEEAFRSDEDLSAFAKAEELKKEEITVVPRKPGEGSGS